MAQEVQQRSPAVAIANAVVQIHKEGFGKGATRARTRMADDVIVVELEDVLTRAEQTLVAAGCEDQIRENRQIFHQARRDQFVGAVEELTGRKVRAFMSQVHFDPNIAVEVFLLEPEGEEA
jgi:uncharacterized protein YbcI